MPEPYLCWTLRLLALAHAVGSAELLAARALFSRGGRADWTLLRTIHPEPRARILDPLFGVRGLMGLLVLRLGAALWLLSRPESWLALCLLALCLSLITVRFRPLVLDSGDGFLLTVTMATLLATSVDPFAHGALFWFVAGQASLSYFTAALYKVRAGWGNGRFLADVIECKLLVAPAQAARLRQYPWLLVLGERWVLGFQLAAPLVFLLGTPFARLFILASFSFHLMGSWLLGLRPFSFAYLSCYPAILWCASRNLGA